MIVTGKGGTGKTTVAAALALAAARDGRRVLVAEIEPEGRIARLLAGGSRPVGYAGRVLQPGLTAVQIDPFEALAEYLTLQIGLRGLVGRVLRYRSFRQLLTASPGWRELITLGKVWHLEQQRDDDGRPRFDLIVVDAPATGHGVSFLDVPRVVVSAIRAGPLRRHASWVEEMIEDAQRTLLLPVALAEELPARETAELVRRVREGMGIAVDRVVVNGVMDAPFPPGCEDLDVHLARLPEDVDLGRLPRPHVLAACAGHLRARYELNRHYVEQIGRLTGLPVVPLPYGPKGIRGPEDLAALGAALLERAPAAAA